VKIYVGTSGFGYKEWKGTFYPKKIAAGDMLRSYSEHLNAVEINNTFYHMPTEKLLSSWADQVPDDFLFSLKVPQIITHIKRLKDVDAQTDYLFKTVSVLAERLGPILFQFPNSFRPDPSTVEAFLSLIPRTKPCAFEFRSAIRSDPKILDLLRQKGCSPALADSDEDPVTDLISTAEWGYLRLRRSDYDDKSLLEWRERIVAQDWERAFVFFKHEDGAKGPEMAVHFRELFRTG
jgi:uncharacterized protein YecE (DUF72 family)